MNLSKIQTTLCLLLALWLTGNCIDEDLSNCGVEAQISYTLEIVAELEAELEAQLDTTSDPEKQSELKKKFTDALNSIFTMKGELVPRLKPGVANYQPVGHIQNNTLNFIYLFS